MLNFLAHCAPILFPFQINLKKSIRNCKIKKDVTLLKLLFIRNNVLKTF